MPDPVAIWDEFTLYVGRHKGIQFECYEADLETELVVEATDVFRFKVWDTDAAAPDIEVESIGPESQTFTADAGTDVITSAAHGRSDGDTVFLTNSGGALPAGLSVETVYYVRDATTNTFTLSATSGGSAIDITDAGTGTHTWHKASHITVDNVGVASTTPATVTVSLGQYDTDVLSEGDYEGELALIDDDDDDAIKTIIRGPIRVEGSATGDRGID